MLRHQKRGVYIYLASQNIYYMNLCKGRIKKKKKKKDSTYTTSSGEPMGEPSHSAQLTVAF